MLSKISYLTQRHRARNMTSHVYNEEMAVEIYETIKNNHAQIQTLITELEKY